MVIKMLIEKVKVLGQRRVQGDYRLLVLRSHAIAPKVAPGQFVHLRIPNFDEAALRRPFSVFDARSGQLELLYKSVGRGTRAMQILRAGDRISLLGPLGKGFPVPKQGVVPVLVAGGYGMAALYLLARSSPARGLVFVGGGGSADILCVNRFRALGWRVLIATEDGSRGAKGLATDILDNWLRVARARKLEFFACGPRGLLRAVAQRAVAGGWPGWVSLDRHMGCGLGACLACVQKVKKNPPRHTGASDEQACADPEWEWARVCTEGPVFDCRNIVWEDDE